MGTGDCKDQMDSAAAGSAHAGFKEDIGLTKHVTEELSHFPSDNQGKSPSEKPFFNKWPLETSLIFVYNQPDVSSVNSY